MKEATTKKQSLGKGLSALLGPELHAAENIPNDRIKTDISMMDIAPGRYQPRQIFKEEDIKDLAASMEQMGILQPILVRRLENESYEIIAGERRWRAATLLGLQTIPAIVKDFNDHEMFEAALIENMQRKDLSSIEEAEGIADYMKEFDYTQEQISQKLGKSRSYIANILRLTALPLKVKTALLGGKLTAGHARALLSSDDPEGIMKQVLKLKMNVRATEELAKQHLQKPSSKPKTTAKPKDNDLLDIQEHLAKIFNGKVTVDVKNGKGKITIHFTSLRMLDDLIGKMGRISDSSPNRS